MPAPRAGDYDRHNIIEVGAERVDHIASANVPDDLLEELQDLSLEGLRKSVTVKFHQNDPYHAVFSLVHVDASIANAFRRILLSSLPHLAIETVYVHNNTSIVQDEVLAARLGLVPLKGNPVGLRWLRWRHKKAQDENAPEGDDMYDFNTIRLELKIACEGKPGWKELIQRGESDPDALYKNHSVYARDLKFIPYGAQAELFSAENGAIEPVNPEILLAKLRPGQELDIEMDALLGVGADHAKHSPVATASYRLLPTIDITQPILGKDAEKFQQCFPPGVIDVVRVTGKEAKKKGSGYEGHEGESKAVVKDTFRDTVSRECLRHDEFNGKVKLGRQRDHFIFSVESVGQQESEILFLDAIQHLRDKCVRMKRCVQDLKDRG